MKKLVLAAALLTVGLMSANEKTVEELDSSAKKRCVLVESDCGEAGLACDDELNVDGEIFHEVIDEMRQLLNEAFCGYGD